MKALKRLRLGQNSTKAVLLSDSNPGLSVVLSRIILLCCHISVIMLSGFSNKVTV
jgi:hypothetical protein